MSEAQKDNLDALLRDALVARVRAAEDEAQGVRNLVYAADLPGLERERDSALAARDAVAAELAALREGLGRLADEWRQQGREAKAYENRAHASEIHEVMAEAHWFPERASELRTLLDQTRGEFDE